MPEQQESWIKVSEWGGLATLLSLGVRFYQKARNTGQADRISKLEHQARVAVDARREDQRVMEDIRGNLQEVDSKFTTRLRSHGNRIDALEIGQSDMDRDIRDELAKMVEKLNRRLTASAATREQPQLPSQR